MLTIAMLLAMESSIVQNFYTPVKEIRVNVDKGNVYMYTNNNTSFTYTPYKTSATPKIDAQKEVLSIEIKNKYS